MTRIPTPEDRDWKSYWQEREKDKSHQALTRQEKRDARRRYHKKNRQQVKEFLKDELP